MQSNTEIQQSVSRNTDSIVEESTAETRRINERIVERRMSIPNSAGNQYVESETITERTTESMSQTESVSTTQTTDTLAMQVHTTDDVKVKEKQQTEESPWRLLIVIALATLTWICAKKIYSMS